MIANCDWPKGAGEPRAAARAALSTPAPSRRARLPQPGLAARAASARASSGRGGTAGPRRSASRCRRVVGSVVVRGGPLCG